MLKEQVISNQEIKNHGGERPGAGRKKVFSDPVNISFKTEASLKIAAKKIFGKSLNARFNEWLNSEIKSKKS